MDFDDARAALLAFKGAMETSPFGPDVIVFKVMSKMFALMPIEGEPARINLKCDPLRAIDLRTAFPAVQPGYHMNKRHWNTVLLDGTIPVEEVRSMMRHSYELVVKGLKKAQREALG